MKRALILLLLAPLLARAEETAGPEAPAVGQASPRLEVVLEGLPDYVQPGVRGALSAERQKDSVYLDDLLVDHLARRAEEEALAAMQASGFYRAEVAVEVHNQAPGWRMVLRFRPGPVVLIRAVRVELVGPGKEDWPLVAHVKQFPLVANGPLVHVPYEDFKADWLKLAREHGYLDARFTRHEILVDPEAGTADVDLCMDTGEPYVFGITLFTQEGEQRFESTLLEGFRSWKEGDPYRLPRLLELHRGLSDTGYFSVVDISPRPDPARHVVDVGVRLAARPRTRYSFGAGFGTDTGPRGSVEIEQRYLNARGDRLFGRLRGSAIDAQAEVEYRRPWLTQGRSPRTDYLSAAVDYRRETVADIETETLQLRASAHDVQGFWRRQASLGWLTEVYRVEGEPEATSHLLMPALKLGYRPRRDRRGGGWRLDWEMRGALDGLLSDTSLLQARVDASWTFPVRQHDQWLLRGSLGTSWADDFDKVPISLRYFAGGDLSVRGYGYKSLGPVNDEGAVVGGKHLVVLSAEYDWMFADPWGMALFVDAGNAFNGSAIELKTGLGLGLRWRSPVGLVGLDVAHGLDNPTDAFRIHFTLGVEL
ncbi:MAG: autotransporter assembly complex family protein [Gammaproteobacteria bacterium]|nr:autotransporter assembly complex family protein [Gammaproteobacteria bacterium]